MAVVRLDKIAGIHLASVKHNADMTNGLFVQLGDLVAGETELYEVAVPSVDADLQKEFLLHATPEVDPDPRKAGLKHFVVQAGGQGRAYHLAVGDIVTLTNDLIDGTPTVGQFAVPQLGSMKLEASADGATLAEDGTTPVEPRLQLKVIQATSLGYDNSDAVALRVVKA